jgi:hypothetical protein
MRSMCDARVERLDAVTANTFRDDASDCDADFAKRRRLTSHVDL